MFQSSAPAFLRHLRWSPKRTPVLTAAVDLPRWDRNSKNRLLSFNHPNIDLTMKNMNLMVKTGFNQQAWEFSWNFTNNKDSTMVNLLIAASLTDGFGAHISIVACVNLNQFLAQGAVLGVGQYLQDHGIHPQQPQNWMFIHVTLCSFLEKSICLQCSLFSRIG